MNSKELAALLTGREYGSEITKAEAAQAKLDGLVVVYGASDDLIEFAGAIRDEVDAYNGGVAYLHGGALLTNDCDNDECPHFDKLRSKSRTIQAVWNVDGYSWRYLTKIPHETFEIVEDGEKYCQGIVFAIQDVGQCQS